MRSGTLRTFDTLNSIPFPAIYPVRIGYTFDSLLVTAVAEPAVYYGLLAKEIEVVRDFREVRVVLDERARWHDGTPVTASDVEFTFRTLREFGFPTYREAFALVDVQIEAPDTLIFRNAAPRSWRWIEQLGLMKIQSRAYWSDKDVTADTMVPPLGSGPYKVSDVDQNRRFSLVRNDRYWAADHPANARRWNFDELLVEYFFEKFTMMAALKRGELDVLLEADAGDWRDGYAGSALETGKLRRSAIKSPNGGNLQMLVFNLRKPPLQDQRFRQAVSLVFEHEWYEDYFGGVYDTPAGLYAGTRLAADGPIRKREERLLRPFASQLPDGLTAAPGPESGRTGMSTRARARLADALLRDAGYQVVDGRRIDPKTGTPVSLTLVTANTDLAKSLSPFRAWLDRIGIELLISVQDPSNTRQLIFASEFDLTPITWRPDDPPGRLEGYIWDSSFAEDQGFGLAGLESEVADTLIQKMRSSTDEEDIVAAARAFDRYMRWSQYAIPMWRESDVWFVHRSELSFPRDVDPARLPDELWWWSD